MLFNDLFNPSATCGPLQVEAPEAPSGVLFERRRGPRRNLHKPTEVRLRGVGDEMGWRCHGAVLNVGIDGMACRVTLNDALTLLVDQHVDVSFRLGGVSTDFDLRARITNVTPAGSTDHRVIGLEFVEGTRLADARPALREAISHVEEAKG